RRIAIPFHPPLVPHVRASDERLSPPLHGAHGGVRSPAAPGNPGGGPTHPSLGPVHGAEADGSSGSRGAPAAPGGRHSRSGRARPGTLFRLAVHSAKPPIRGSAAPVRLAVPAFRGRRSRPSGGGATILG